MDLAKKKSDNKFEQEESIQENVQLTDFIPDNGDEVIIHNLFLQGNTVTTRKELMQLGFNAGACGILRDDGVSFTTYKLVSTGKKDEYTINK